MSTETISREKVKQFEDQAVKDYLAAAGKVFLVSDVVGYIGDESRDLHFDPPVRMRLDVMSEDQFRQHEMVWHYNLLDVYWSFTLLDTDHPKANQHRSFWYYGPSYDASKPLDEAVIRKARKNAERYVKPVPTLWNRLRRRFFGA